MSSTFDQKVKEYTQLRTPGQNFLSALLTVAVVIVPLFINFLTFLLAVCLLVAFVMAARVVHQERVRGLVDTPFQKNGTLWITLVFSLMMLSVGGNQREGWSWPYACAAVALPWAFYALAWLIDRMNGKQHSIESQVVRDKIEYGKVETLVEAWDGYDSTQAVVWAETLSEDDYRLLMDALVARRGECNLADHQKQSEVSQA